MAENLRTVTVRTKMGRLVVFPNEPTGRMWDLTEQVRATLDPNDRVVETMSVPQDTDVPLHPQGWFPDEGI